MGIDATRPFIYKDAFERARYNIEVVDLAKFYSPEQIRQAGPGSATTRSSWPTAGFDEHRGARGLESHRGSEPPLPDAHRFEAEDCAGKPALESVPTTRALS